MTQSYEDESPKITIRVTPDLKKRIQANAENQSRFVRDAIREKLPDPDEELPVEPPDDSELALAYRLLRNMANDNGWVKERIAKNRLSQKLSMDKDSVRRHVLRELAQRGYLEMQSDSIGRQVSYRIIHA